MPANPEAEIRMAVIVAVNSMANLDAAAAAVIVVASVVLQ